MGISKEKQQDFPSQVAENCACTAMRCRDIDQMSDLSIFLDRIESITKRASQDHPISSFSFYVFNGLTGPMLWISTYYKISCLQWEVRNLAVFNLNIGIIVFENCVLPVDIPAFVSDFVLSRPCQVLLRESQTEKIYV